MVLGRRWFAVLAVALAIAGSAVVAAGGSAGAQTDITCRYEVLAGAAVNGQVEVTVQGYAPGSSVVRIFFNPLPNPPNDAEIVASASSDPVTGYFEASFTTTVSGEVTVGVDGYATDLCIFTPGVVSGDVGLAGQGVIVVGAGRGRLGYTGSSSTGSYVLLGLAAIAVGLVLLVGSRRLMGVRGRGTGA